MGADEGKVSKVSKSSRGATEERMFVAVQREDGRKGDDGDGGSAVEKTGT